MGMFTLEENALYEFGDIEAIRCDYDDPIEASLNIVAESEMNYNAIMQAVGIGEVQFYERTGEGIVYEGARLESFFGKVKSFFLKNLAKTKGMIAKFLTKFRSTFKTDELFIKKYKYAIQGADSSGFTMKGFNYTVQDKPKRIITAYKAMSKAITSMGFGVKSVTAISADEDGHASIPTGARNALESNMNELKDELRGVAIGAFGGDRTPCPAKEFNKKMFAVCRDGETSPIQISPNINECLNIYMGSKAKVREIENLYAYQKECAADSLRDIKHAEKVIKSGNARRFKVGPRVKTETSSIQIKLVHKSIDLMKETNSIIQVAVGNILDALLKETKQAKKACVKALRYSKKASKYRDSEVEESFLYNIDLI